jgi:2-enoate reductase
MVALGRTLVADPHWVNKAGRGDFRRIIPCIRCNVCYHQLWLGQYLCCSMNPYVFKESQQELSPAPRAKKVMVIGAGPAGIRCALTASKRGHAVTLYEKQPYIGGMVYPGSRPVFKVDVARAIDWFSAELENSTVTVKLNTAVTPEMIEREAPDALVLAFGGEPVKLDLPGADKPHVVPAVEALRDISRFSGKKAVVVGGGDVGCETACHLANHGFETTIIEILPRLMEENINTNVKVQMFNLLDEKNVKVMTETRANAFIDGGIEVILPNGKQWGLEADVVAVAVGIKPNEERLKKFDLLAEEVYFIGDCAAPGRIREATEAGERVGRWI